MHTSSNSLNRAWLEQFWRLAWPISLQAVLLSLLSLVDVLMVATIGDAEVAAVGYAGRAFFVAIIILNGFSTACATLSAQHWGSKNWPAIGRTVALSFYAGLLFTAIALGLMLLSPTTIMQWGSSDAQLIAIGADYIQVTALMLLFTLPVTLVESALRASGNTKLPLYISMFAVVTNIALNQILIFGLGPIPAMGVVGAGIATVVARALQLLILSVILKLQDHPLLKVSFIGFWQLHKTEWLNYAKLAVPLVINFGIWSIGVFVYATLYGQLGTNALAAMSLISPIEGIAISCFIGFSAACSIMIGNKLGVNQFTQAWKDARASLIVSPIAAMGIGVLVWLLSYPLLNLFGALESDTLNLARQLILILATTTWIRIFNMVLINGILRSGGDNGFCLMSDTFCQWGVGLMATSIAILVFDVSLLTAYCIALSEEVCKALLCFWRMNQKKWLRNLTTGSFAETN
ncbi:MATE family efflux transporter [Agarivorans sp. Z349TD_8]|uniref:MATE family efflux transporter n=1 Tax=Agarivorans sp. Z349TD_8 TaxID=3421434 RepID=UPI003D7EF541